MLHAFLDSGRLGRGGRRPRPLSRSGPHGPTIHHDAATGLRMSIANRGVCTETWRAVSGWSRPPRFPYNSGFPGGRCEIRPRVRARGADGPDPTYTVDWIGEGVHLLTAAPAADNSCSEVLGREAHRPTPSRQPPHHPIGSVHPVMWICPACLLVFSIELSCCPSCGQAVLSDRRSSTKTPTGTVERPDEESRPPDPA